MQQTQRGIHRFGSLVKSRSTLRRACLAPHRLQSSAILATGQPTQSTSEEKNIQQISASRLGQLPLAHNLTTKTLVDTPEKRTRTSSPLLRTGGLRKELSRVETVILDCDGVLWQGNKAIEGAAETIAHLRQMGKRILFVTNNSSKSRREYVKKFAALGIAGVEVDHVIGAAFTAVEWLQENKHTKKVMVIGPEGILHELEEADIPYQNATSEHPEANCTVDDFRELVKSVDEDISAVVVGADESFSYRKLCIASIAIQRGAALVVTNGDTYDRIGNLLMPGTGALSAAISASTGKMPSVITGKPYSFLIDTLRKKYGVDFSKTLVVGDRLDTDIAMGRNADAAICCHVLTGVSTLQDAATAYANQSSCAPHMCIQSISSLLD